MLMMVLKDVGHLLPFKAMASAAIRSKRHSWEWFSRLQVIVSTEHVSRLCHEPKRVFANAVMMALVSAFSFRKQTQYIANTWGLVLRARGWVIDHANDTFRQETHLL